MWADQTIYLKILDYSNHEKVFFLGLPPYDWWVQPPDEVLLKVYVFNITNSEEFLNGTDKNLRVQEIGPIVYR